ncbi:MAG: ccmA [Sphingomonadales bacterium]|nr:ccmA [Sphingomonadales bacterium]
MQGSGQSQETGLIFDRVACRRGGRVLFSDVSFALAPGNALVVSGPNGVGKSSLLRLAAGLLDPIEGAVRCGGAVALADEHPALDLTLPLERALRFWADLDGGDVGAALATVGLAHLAEVPVRMLSTGQRRRATLARVLASGAAIWLLDEPGNGLDAASIAMLEGVIARHRAACGIVVVASHQELAVPGAMELALTLPFSSEVERRPTDAMPESSVSTALDTKGGGAV